MLDDFSGAAGFSLPVAVPIPSQGEKGSVSASRLPEPYPGDTGPDPLADTIAEYYAGVAAFEAIPGGMITFANEEDFVQATYGPASHRLWKDCPPATSLRGVAEAIRYTLADKCITSRSAENTLIAALAFLEREAGL